jgi:ADP-ribose pyrophosphatase YjhB (NUDIX family)
MSLPEQFRYCPACKSDALTGREGKGWQCGDCGFTYYHNMACAAAAIIEHEAQIVLTTRANPPQAGFLDLPGGFADYDETIEESLRREIREELQISTTELRYFTSAPNEYIYKDIQYCVMDVFFTCRADDIEKMRPTEEIAEAGLFEPGQIDLGRIAFKSTRAALQRYMRRV